MAGPSCYELLDYQVVDDRLVLKAIVEDMVITHRQTFLDPAEYGPARCKGYVWLDEEGAASFQDLQSVEAYLDAIKADPDWEVEAADDDCNGGEA